jgi:DUF4097 and DUF4098 domain-containing protein YvlB
MHKNLDESIRAAVSSATSAIEQAMEQGIQAAEAAIASAIAIAEREAQRAGELGQQFGKGFRHEDSLIKSIAGISSVDLELRNANGVVEIAGHDANELAIHVRIRVYSASSGRIESCVRAVEAGILVEGERVRIEVPEELQRSHARVDYQLRLPRASRAAVRVANGSVRVAGIDGPVQLDAVNGAVEAERISHEVEMHTVNGRIELAEIGAKATLTTQNGSIRARRVAGPLSVRTLNGRIQVAEAGGTLEAQSVNGAIQYEGPVTRDFEISTTNGGIKLRLPADSLFELDAKSEAGHVSSEFSVSEAEPQTAEDPYRSPNQGALPLVRLRSIAGSIAITKR